MSYNVAEQYIAAFSKLAKQGNTILLPSNAGDVTSMVAQVRNIQTGDTSKNESDIENLLQK